jgi:hypothetical protein
MLHSEENGKNQDFRKIFIFVVSKEMEILGMHVSTGTVQDRSMEI